MKLNKKEIIILAVAFLLIIGLVVYRIFFYGGAKSADAMKFKEEYEKYNNEEGYRKIEISADNPIVYSSYKEIFEVLESGTGVILFGFPTCPWCRIAVPVMLEAAKDTGIDKIYYLNNRDDRDTKKLENGEVITEKEGTKDYYTLLEKLGSHVSVYDGLEDESIKRLYFPTVIVVENGEITLYHEATLDDHLDPANDLTTEQRDRLKNIYKTAFESMLVCDPSGC